MPWYEQRTRNVVSILLSPKRGWRNCCPMRPHGKKTLTSPAALVGLPRQIKEQVPIWGGISGGERDDFVGTAFGNRPLTGATLHQREAGMLGSSLSSQRPKQIEAAVSLGGAWEGLPPLYLGHAEKISFLQKSFEPETKHPYWLLALSNRSLSFLRGKKHSNGT